MVFRNIFIADDGNSLTTTRMPFGHLSSGPQPNFLLCKSSLLPLPNRSSVVYETILLYRKLFFASLLTNWFVTEWPIRIRLRSGPALCFSLRKLLVDFGFTADVGPVNKFTIPYHFPMPNIEDELTTIHRSTCFANFDFVMAYWQLALHSDSRECQSFITPDGIFTPTRVLHGSTNAVLYLQANLTAIFSPSLRDFFLIWLDDLLLHRQTPEELLDSIEEFFKICVKYNLKLHPGKCVLFANDIRWCGRLISADGVKFDPRRMGGLVTMEPPVTGADLQQCFVQCNGSNSVSPRLTN